MEIEVCVEKLETALIADQLGANRIELCSALDLGGLTPSLGIIEACVEKCSLDVFVMIRPKSGGFVYTTNEVEIMLKDIKSAASLDAHGVVFGCLDYNNRLDSFQNKQLLDYAKSFGLGVTFHRAFDRCNNPDEAIFELIDQGFDRILTSGQEKTAIEGITNLIKWKNLVGNKIQLMAGSGVNPTNSKQLISSGIDALHFTARKISSKTDILNMGVEYSVDKEKIQSIISEIH